MSKNIEHNNLLSKWLNKELSPEETQDLQKKGDLNDLKVVLDDIDTWSIEKMNVSKSYAHLKTKRDKPQTKVIQFGSLMKIAAAVILLIVAYISYDNFLNDDIIKLATDIGEKQTIELPDGSTVQLDAMSKLSYNEKNWADNRTLELEGQAYFEVNKGTTFQVKTKLGNVTVLGTKFNVIQSNQAFNTDCFEGSVKVQSNNNSQILKANESAQLEGNNLIKHTNAANKPDWVEEFSQFKEAKLSEVTLELKKYYKIDIDLPESYANLKFTGKFPHNNLVAALQNIFIPMEIKYSINDEGKVVFS